MVRSNFLPEMLGTYSFWRELVDQSANGDTQTCQKKSTQTCQKNSTQTCQQCSIYEKPTTGLMRLLNRADQKPHGGGCCATPCNPWGLINKVMSFFFSSSPWWGNPFLPDASKIRIQNSGSAHRNGNAGAMIPIKMAFVEMPIKMVKMASISIFQ